MAFLAFSLPCFQLAYVLGESCPLACYIFFFAFRFTFFSPRAARPPHAPRQMRYNVDRALAQRLSFTPIPVYRFPDASTSNAFDMFGVLGASKKPSTSLRRAIASLRPSAISSLV